ncbi:hypothetical protein DYB32_009185 [Aphanomyces invadans]|uniref:DDE Tnp4 domain-containing protein n=1 Tax=Aphanomyces invadans TaxID=157072 RepID=A0A418AJ86_9STRA|nr:hypothetical protein DYB32_009185 [Aphanomyces invadans]
MTFLQALHTFLVKKYVTNVAEKWTMKHIVLTGNQFTNFPHARYATDVAFQRTNIPVGSYAEKKLYYSGKHSLYGHKVEVSVVPSGFAIDCTAHFKGSVSYKTIFDANLGFHLCHLSKQADESTLDDQDDSDATQWAVLADKGYQGIQRDVRAVLPTKKPPRGVLTSDNVRRNDRIASVRVVVENWFGRMKCLRAVCSDIYRWSRKSYDVVFQTCAALTNVHVRFHPLRAEDGDAHAQNVNRLMSMGDKVTKNKSAESRTYRLKRKGRLSMSSN